MFIVQLQSRDGRKNLDHARSRDEAECLVQEYQTAYGASARVTYRTARPKNRGIDGRRA